jgi:hypothetical protein
LKFILFHIPSPNIFHNKTNHTDSPLHHQANQTYDLVPTYDYMYFDGIYFRNKMNDEKLYKVARFEIGALYEIGRILAENGIR